MFSRVTSTLARKWRENALRNTGIITGSTIGIIAACDTNQSTSSNVKSCIPPMLIAGVIGGVAAPFAREAFFGIGYQSITIFGRYSSQLASGAVGFVAGRASTLMFSTPKPINAYSENADANNQTPSIGLNK